MDFKAEIENKLHDYFTKAERAKAKQQKDLLNFQVYAKVINECEARASELSWVLLLMEQSKDLSPQLQQADVIRSVCKCGNQLTEKELFYETCLQCNDVVIAN